MKEKKIEGKKVQRAKNLVRIDMEAFRDPPIQKLRKNTPFSVKKFIEEVNIIERNYQKKKFFVTVVSDYTAQSDTIRISLHLDERFELTAHSLTEALQIDWNEHPLIDTAVIFIDSHNFSNALILIRTLRLSPRHRQLPIFCLLREVDSNSAIKLYETGVDDCVKLPVDNTFSYKVLRAISKYRNLEYQVTSELEGFKVGDIVKGKYRIIEKLGQGGMGIIYRVRHTLLGLDLALKALKLSRLHSERALIRFEREIRALAAIRHPNLVRIYDSDIDNHIPYYVMEYLPKGSLYYRLRKDGPLHPIEALKIISKIAEGLHQAHSRGILHRDIKSENILFDSEGQPVLIDFGLSILKEELSRDERVTKAGCVVGTPHYMSPEQMISPRKIDARSDVFALGIILYEMLLGYHPLLKHSRAEVMIKIATEDFPPIESLKPNLPKSIAQITRRAVQRRRENRYQSAMELAQACRDAISDLIALFPYRKKDTF